MAEDRKESISEWEPVSELKPTISSPGQSWNEESDVNNVKKRSGCCG